MTRRNADGSLSVGILEDMQPEIEELKEEIETPVAEEKPAPKKGGRPKKK